MKSPMRIDSPSGLSIEFNANGSIRRMMHGDIMLNLFPGTEADGGLANIYLRRHEGDAVDFTPLFGPRSPASLAIDQHGLFAEGNWNGITFRLRFVLAEDAPAWFWHVELQNTSGTVVTCDLIHTQDIGLAPYGMIRLNEFYVSQYVDHTPLAHPERGIAIASRQNQMAGDRCPWTIIGSLNRSVSYATDALQAFGLTSRAAATTMGLLNGLPGKRLQHEHSMVSLQDATIVLEPGRIVQSGFLGWYAADKTEATNAGDATKIDDVLRLREATPMEWPHALNLPSRSGSLFTSAPLLDTLPLTAEDVTSSFGSDLRHVERQQGELLSFFTRTGSHVVLKHKELQVLRPHGHILRTGGALTPDESALTSTSWMGGVFHSMITQGHVSINRLLSTCHTYLGLFRSHGQRVFVELDGRWHLLDVPSAFEMYPDRCRWIYKHVCGVIEVIASASAAKHELELSLRVQEGPAVRFLISHHIAINGDDGSQAIPALWEKQNDGVFVHAVADSDVGRRFPSGRFLIRPAEETQIESVGGDECLFVDGVSREQPFLCFVTAPSRTAALIIEGKLIEPEPLPMISSFWDAVAGRLEIEAPPASPLADRANRVAEIFPWFIQNALVHYLAPRGLEQYSGGGWGTRDVSQGPVELLLALGRLEPIRDLLCRVFRQQNANGDWPQWFMFFERERNIRPDDSHGDIVYWPLVALAQYLRATNDAELLAESLPFFHRDGDDAAEKATVWQHVERALDLIRRRVIPGTHLAAYGHGDWNDSLQPVKPDMRDQLCSSWTVTLSYQMLTTLADALDQVGKPAQATTLRSDASKILYEFQRTLIVEGTIAGLAYFHADGRTDFLLHPRDGQTGLHFSVLPMIHAIINDMLTPQQATAQLDLIRKHLTGPDGVRLFDRPLAYHGGLRRYFQRAESASYFGREIGLMYTHAHLRYCEALARIGDAEAFFEALSQVIPIGIREHVSSAALRQANCYFSSSDAAFADRYEAYDEYDKALAGKVALEGGWRIYSSGPGVAVRLIMQCFLGIRFERTALVVDPVIPASLDGIKAKLRIAGHAIEVVYRITNKGCGPLSVTLNGAALAFTQEANAYRTGAARIAMSDVVRKLTGDGDILQITLG